MTQQDILKFFYKKRIDEKDDSYFCLDEMQTEIKLKQTIPQLHLKLRQLVRYGFLEINEQYILELISKGKKAKKKYRLNKDSILRARDFI